MRKFLAVAKATALEMASEPLALLLTMSAIALTVMAPVFHYHQFGESSRMAREAGLSALMIFGIAFAVFCTVKAFRREIESGTLEMALAHPISRAGFFLAKLCGAFAAFAAFAATVASVTVTMTIGAEIGGEISRNTHDIAKVYAPSVALALAALVAPLVLGAALNRFARRRFTLTAMVTMLAVAVLGQFPLFRWSVFSRLAPVALMLALPAAVFIAASAAFAVRWRANAATSAAGVLFALALPFLGNYYLSDALAKGGSLPLAHVALAAALTAPLVAAFVLTGLKWFESQDLKHD